MTVCFLRLLILRREQAAGAKDQPVSGAPGGQSRPDQLLHQLPDQPGLPARRDVVREARGRVGGGRAPAED